MLNERDPAATWTFLVLVSPLCLCLSGRKRSGADGALSLYGCEKRQHGSIYGRSCGGFQTREELRSLVTFSGKNVCVCFFLFSHVARKKKKKKSLMPSLCGEGRSNTSCCARTQGKHTAEEESPASRAINIEIRRGLERT